MVQSIIYLKFEKGLFIFFNLIYEKTYLLQDLLQKIF